MVSRYTYLVINLKHTSAILHPQTKDRLASKEVTPVVAKAVVDKMRLQLDRQVPVIHNLIGRLILELYEKAKIVEKTVTVDENDLKRFVSDKYSGVKSTRPELNELFLVEGDSAGGQIKVRRNPNHQALLQFRGKVRNAANSKRSDVLENKELLTLISVLGCGILDDFDIKKLRFHKIIITTDQDIDGLHIRSLILTFFWLYMPELIIGGYVYFLETPLFVNEMKQPKQVVYTDSQIVRYVYNDRQLKSLQKRYKGENLVVKDAPKDLETYELYAYNDDEQRQLLDMYGSSVIDVSRNKGLGELEKSQTDATILDANTRRLIQVTVDDVDSTTTVVMNLMGSNSATREGLLADND